MWLFGDGFLFIDELVEIFFKLEEIKVMLIVDGERLDIFDSVVFVFIL